MNNFMDYFCNLTLSNEAIAVFFLIFMFLGVGKLLYIRSNDDKKFGVGSIYMVSILTFLPTIAILGLMRVIESQAITTILGAVAGYIFASMDFPIKDD